METYKEFTFEAAHKLEPYSGLHGHSFKVSVHLVGEPDPVYGWAANLYEVEKQIDEIHKILDHTYLNDIEQDKRTLEAFHAFREEAERKRFRYFLEVFDPNVDSGISQDKLGAFINDQILRTLAGITDAGRPVFLKIVYHGPRYMEEICQYDSNMAVGVLGGSAGTTYDAFRLLHDAKKYGARLALFGRKINNAEHQLAFIEFLRLISEDKISPEEAVHAYHGVLQGKGITPKLSLEQDLELTEQSMRYGGEAGKTSVTMAANPLANSKPTNVGWPIKPNGSPDFTSMTADQRLTYYRARLKE